MPIENPLPEGLLLEARDKWQAYQAAATAASLPIPEDAEFLNTVLRVFAFSDFVSRNLILNPDLLEDLVQSGDLRDRRQPGDYLMRLSEKVKTVTDEIGLAQLLCRARRREMVRIAWRDLSGWADLDETMTDLSAFAAACLEVCLSYLYHRQCETFGIPMDSSGTPQRLVVIGMGKLGSGELNFSSDIDLIFAYPESGWTNGDSNAITNEEFFVRLCRKYVKLMGSVTTDGFLFRVDIRLRPFGDSGPLVMSFDNMEDYFQRQGRDWERYAWIKAKAVAGDLAAGECLLDRLKPFVYRRYLDYGAFESLRDMKQKIVLELKRKGMTDNIKLGPGGIREIEFFGQTFQLLRGGVTLSLQCGPIQDTLKRLVRENHIAPDTCIQLTEAYHFLRNTEHRLQEYADQQTHQLPENPMDRERLAAAMGFSSAERFYEELERHRNQVHGYFQQLLEPDKSENAHNGETHFKEQDGQLASVWLSPKPESLEMEVLSNAGFKDPGAVLKLLEAFQLDPVTRALSQSGRKRLDNIIPGLLARTASARQPLLVLGRILDLIKTIGGRIAYLALLQENPGALTRLVEFADASPWMISYLMHHPVLLDELLDDRTLFVPPKRAALEEEITHRFEMIDPADLEYQMEMLRVFKQVNTLRVAAADITGALPLMKVSDHLSDIAEISVEKTVSLSWRHLAEKHGTPTPDRSEMPFGNGFGVIAYGKLGGLELGYDSDIDLVFLHSCNTPYTEDGPRPIDTPQFFARLGQRVIHFMTAHTAAGILYETDMRLRPSGTSGLLVSHIDAWEEYQMQKAWTWEHQALVRARGIFGDPALLARFEQIRQRVLSRPRQRDTLKKEVSAMRERMRKEHGKYRLTEFHLKQDRGGMVDIEFMVQFMLLLAAHRFPHILKWSDNVRQIQALAEAKIIEDDMAHRLRMAYLTYRSIAHRLSLQEKPPVVPAEQMKSLRRTVIRYWNRILH